MLGYCEILLGGSIEFIILALYIHLQVTLIDWKMLHIICVIAACEYFFYGYYNE